MAIQAINGLKILWSPVLPFTSQQLHDMLGESDSLFGRQVLETYEESSRSHVALTYDPAASIGRWERVDIPSGRQLPQPIPLFKKLDAEIIADELARLGPKPVTDSQSE
ncbi:MAG: hypothetical protein R3C44_01880 [Chloroflexota bacterium]